MKQLHLPASSIDEIFTATSHNQSNLAELYQSQGRYNEAEPLYGRSLAILEQRLGMNHPNTVTGRRNLEQLREKMNGDEMME